MTPEQKVKYLILLKRNEWDPESITEQITADNVDRLYRVDDDYLQDAMYEIRCGQVVTNLPCEYSRHYESKSVAAKLPDGSWVGWTYWYGGGKHAEPEAIDWIDSAYSVACAEEEKMVIVRTFSRPEV